nr:hypothetical protein [bacterium]
VLGEDEDFDDIDDEELRERLEDAGILEPVEEFRTPRDGDADLETEEETESLGGTVHQVRWDPVDNRYAYLATDHGLYVSVDGGISWSQRRTGLINSSRPVTGVAVLQPSGKILIIEDGSLSISDDHGNSFVDFPAAEPFGKITDLEPDATRPDTAICSGQNGLFIVTAEGTARKIPFPPSLSTRDISAAASDNATHCFIAFLNRLYYLTTDGTWIETRTAPWGRDDIRDMAVSSESVIIAGARGVYIWNRDTATGQFMNTALTETDIRDVVIDPGDPRKIWIATASGVFMFGPRREKSPEPVTFSAIPEDFPRIEQVLSAAMEFAEISLTRDTVWVQQAKRRNLYPIVDFQADYTDINWEGYAKTDVVVISDGTPFIGPIDELYVRQDDHRFDVSLAFKWYPVFGTFTNDDIKVRKRLGEEIGRRNKILNDVRIVYYQLASEWTRDIETPAKLRAKVMAHIQKQELQARLDAMTGFKFEVIAPQ